MNAHGIRWNLHNFETLKRDIEMLKLDLYEYRQMDGVKAQVITDMPICHSGVSAIEKIASLVDYVRQLETELDGKLRIQRAINTTYMYLKEPHRSIIEMRYFITPTKNDVRKRKYNWAEIAEEVNYSEDYCKELDCKIVLQILNKLHETTHVLPMVI